jgi:hypothetical protein
MTRHPDGPAMVQFRPIRVEPEIPVFAAMAVFSPISTLWPIWIWLSSLTPSPIKVSPIAPRSTVVLAPISTSSPRIAADLRNAHPTIAVARETEALPPDHAARVQSARLPTRCPHRGSRAPPVGSPRRSDPLAEDAARSEEDARPDHDAGLQTQVGPTHAVGSTWASGSTTALGWIPPTTGGSGYRIRAAFGQTSDRGCRSAGPAPGSIGIGAGRITQPARVASRCRGSARRRESSGRRIGGRQGAIRQTRATGSPRKRNPQDGRQFAERDLHGVTKQADRLRTNAITCRRTPV